MTLIRVDLRRRLAVEGIDAGIAPGSLEVAPLRRESVEGDPDYVRVPISDYPRLIDGRADIILSPGYWVITERVPRGIRRHVLVPDVEQVDYDDLVDIDPATLDPAAEPEAAWWATAGEAITAATTAGQAATAAATDADAAQQSATAASTAATSAETAATAAATDAAQAVAAVATKQDAAALDTDTATLATTPGTALHTGVTAQIQGAIDAAASDYQPVDSDLTAIAALSTTTFGRSLLTLADAAAGRAAIAGDSAWVTRSSGTLGPSDLDAITTPGFYSQTSSAVGTLARHYPQDGVAGVLEVVSLSGTTFLLQRFTILGSSGSHRGIWIRYCTAGTWQTWSFIPSQRVDNTAGKAIYTWDDTATAERLISYSSGRRDITALCDGLDPANAGTVILSRVDDLVIFEFTNALLVAGSGTLNIWPLITSGFRPRNRSAGVATRNNSTTNESALSIFSTVLAWIAERSLTSGTTTLVRPAIGITGTFAYPAEMALPTTLPGTLVTAP